MEKTMDRRKPLIWIILILLVANLCATGGVVIYLSGDHRAEESGTAFTESEQTTCYTIYIGTNDKDTYTQLISLDEAKDMVNAICARYVEGYTVTEAEGGWVDETGTLTEEQTLVYSFTDVQEEDLISIMDEVLKALNQNSILVETSDVQSFYYDGE
ncbi:MAG: DUF3574 domain-containing protein [Clostridiales bacterium]|nr:DUF3574 domain-containing protein [Clostridiales bacterium]